MQVDPKSTTRHKLNYATDAVERDAERAAAEHRKHVEDYNEATFGERRPIINAITRLIAYLAVGALLIFLLPRSISRPIALLYAAAYVLWERYRAKNL